MYNIIQYNIFGVGKYIRKMVRWCRVFFLFAGSLANVCNFGAWVNPSGKPLKCWIYIFFFDLQPPSFPDDGWILKNCGVIPFITDCEDRTCWLTNPYIDPIVWMGMFYWHDLSSFTPHNINDADYIHHQVSVWEKPRHNICLQNVSHYCRNWFRSIIVTCEGVAKGSL